MEKVLIITIIFLSSCTAVVFQPSKQFYFSPQQAVGMVPDEYRILINDKVSLHTWRFKTKQDRKGVVVQFHGNAENMSSHYVSIAWLINHGYDLVTFDYRGYGQSTGVPSFPEVVSDSFKILEFVRGLYPAETKLIVYGQSLGSVIAANTVRHTQVKVNELILEGAIYSLNQVSAEVLSRHWLTWLLQPMGHVLVSHKYNFKKIAKDFPNIPVLLLHSKQDPIIPYRQSQKIYDKLEVETKCLKLIEEPEHTSIGNVSKGKYRPEILDFIDRQLCS
ncbi:MAG: alpha/beta fold hydrolase [Bdellovibrionota bacterium]